MGVKEKRLGREESRMPHYYEEDLFSIGVKDNKSPIPNKYIKKMCEIPGKRADTLLIF